jgi:hypothetical protein
MPGLIIADASTSASENTMRTATIRSGVLSIERLRKRYRQIDFAKNAAEICEYLRARGTQDLFDRYRVAERAIYPGFGAVGLNRDNNLRTALYYWEAAKDTSSDMLSSVADRQDSFVRALYESQRGNNAKDSEDHAANSGRINFEDNRNPTDNTICMFGVTNKFAECFVALHPDITLLVEIKSTIYDLVRGFIAEYLYSQGKDFNFLKDPMLALENKDILPATAIAQIKNKVIEIFGQATDSYEGFLTFAELKYLNDLLGEYLESVSFVSCINPLEPDNPAVVDKLINDAKYMLSEARANRVSTRRILADSDRSAVQNFDLDLITAVIQSLLPQPDNSSKITGILRYEIRSFNRATNEPVVSYDSGLNLDFLTLFHRAQSYTSGMYSSEQLDAAMQPQATALSTTEASDVRRRRLVALGLRPNQYG